jgi:hypothetical protein
MGTEGDTRMETAQFSEPETTAVMQPDAEPVLETVANLRSFGG